MERIEQSTLIKFDKKLLEWEKRIDDALSCATDEDSLRYLHKQKNIIIHEKTRVYLNSALNDIYQVYEDNGMDIQEKYLMLGRKAYEYVTIDKQFYAEKNKKDADYSDEDIEHFITGELNPLRYILFSIDDAAVELHVPKSRINRWIKNKEIEPIIIDHTIFFEPKEIRSIDKNKMSK